MDGVPAAEVDRGVAETRTIERDVMSSMGASGVPSVSGLARAEEKSLHVVEPSSGEWTNEKHSSYLNSIEASFVNQLYRRGGRSRSMIGWLSRTHRSLAPESSQSNSCCRVPSGQFKVLHKGCWKKLNFERDHTCSNQCNENQMLAANPWVQHFISSSGGGTDVRSCNNLEKGEFSSQAIPLGDQVHALENSGLERNLKLPPTCSSNIYRQDSVGSNKEMSGQNFEQKDSEDCAGGEELSFSERKRRLKVVAFANAYSKDQVVPHGRRPSSHDNDSVKKNHRV